MNMVRAEYGTWKHWFGKEGQRKSDMVRKKKKSEDPLFGHAEEQKLSLFYLKKGQCICLKSPRDALHHIGAFMSKWLNSNTGLEGGTHSLQGLEDAVEEKVPDDFAIFKGGDEPYEEIGHHSQGGGEHDPTSRGEKDNVRGRKRDPTVHND